MFVEARLIGQKQPHLVVPEGALHGNTLYSIDADQRMQPIQVQLLFRRNGLAAIEGLAVGDIATGTQIVTNDLMPAITGARLKIVPGDVVGEKQE